MSCNDVFNFWGKLMCVRQAAVREQRWGRLLQPSLIFTVAVALRLAQPRWLHQAAPCWKDTPELRTLSGHNLLQIFSRYLALLHKVSNSDQSTKGNFHFSQWDFKTDTTLFFQCWGTKFSCLKQEKFPDSQRNPGRYLSVGLIKKPLCTSLLNLCFWDVR